MKCQHLQTQSLYARGPKAQGSKFIPVAKKCVKCGALIQPQSEGAERCQVCLDGGHCNAPGCACPCPQSEGVP